MHTFAYSGSLAQTPNVDVPAVIDDVLTISNNHFIIPTPRKLFVGYAGSATLTLAELNCAKFRQYAPIRILPWNVGALPANNPNVFDASQLSIQLPTNEEIQAICSSGIATGSETVFLLFNVYSQYQTPPQGTVYSYHGVSTTTTNVGSWTTVTTTWDTTLGSGVYGVIGGTVADAGGVGWRIIFPEQSDRPGGLCVGSLANRSWPGFRSGGGGLLGTFQSLALPSIQILAATATSTRDVTLDIVKIA